MSQGIQRYNTFSYGVNEGLLQSTIADFAFDKHNFCWISFPNGIQKFDGKNFTTVPVQPGLPDDKQVLFLRCSNGDLLVSHSHGISKYEISNNRFTQVYSYHSFQKTPAQFIGEDEQIVYFYSQTGHITGINCQTLKTVSEISTGFPDYSSNNNYRPRFSDNIVNHKAAMVIDYSLYLWDLQQGKLLSQSAPIPGLYSLFSLKLKTENEVFYYNLKSTNAIQLYNFNSQKTGSLPIKGKDEQPIGRVNIFSWQNKMMLSFNNHLYETDSTLQILKSELVNFQNQPVAGVQAITRIKEDDFGNIYLQTVSGGIKKIIRNNYPIKYYSTDNQDGNFIISILPDKKNNRILAGTAGNGLLVFDTLQHLIKHIKTLPGRSEPAAPNAIIKTNKGDYLLFIGGEKHVWQLSHDFSQLKSFHISTSLSEDKRGIGYFGKVLFQNEKEAVVQSQNKLYKTTLSNYTTTEHQVSQGYIMSGLFFKNFIITHVDDELIFLDAASFKEIKRISFKNTGNVRCFATPTLQAGKNGTDILYVGSNKGIFKIDGTGKILQHLGKENGLPDECIYAMAFDKEGILWCSTNKGILKINKDNNIQQLKKEDGLQENEFNTNAVASSEDGELFFGGVNGVSSFYPSAITIFEEKISLLITQIKINNEPVSKDTAAWSIDKIVLPYNKNSLSFDFIAMGNSNPEQYIYQYRMEGLDKDWIQNAGLQTVRYYLPPGEYKLKFSATRIFNRDAKALKEIYIVIQLPFWKTWWFRALVLLVLFLAMAYLINERNRSIYRKKLVEFETENKVQIERERISRDLHDSIGAYANAVLYKTELLENEQRPNTKMRLMTDLKFASKDIITSLRETIWALKKESYTAQDCIMRIRNFVQPLGRYYPHINFQIEGEASTEINFHYTKALNVVRILQEAVTNAIKHSNASEIVIKSTQLHNQWQLEVSDDGIGFSENDLEQTERGNGLINMKERALEAAFHLQIISSPGSGTRLIITL